MSAEDQQDRRDVEQQHVLDHVHREQMLLAEAVDRRAQRRHEHEDAAGEREPGADARRVRLVAACARAPADEIEPDERDQRDDDARVERPAMRPETCARIDRIACCAAAGAHVHA